MKKLALVLGRLRKETTDGTDGAADNFEFTLHESDDGDDELDGISCVCAEEVNQTPREEEKKEESTLTESGCG